MPSRFITLWGDEGGYPGGESIEGRLTAALKQLESCLPPIAIFALAAGNSMQTRIDGEDNFDEIHTLPAIGRLPSVGSVIFLFREGWSMDAFLSPIEKPRDPVMRMAYAMTRRQFGKVLTPVKVLWARLPVGFGVFYSKIGKLDKKLQLAPETVMLIRERVARLNVCLFCVDIGRSFAIKASMNEAKFDALNEYRTSPLFSDAERAALDYVTELTRDRQVDPQTFQRLTTHYSERASCEIVWLVASEHFYNVANIGLNIHSDMLCAIARRKHQGESR